jgi:Zn-dependent peptidase ImmA (M78 family)
VRIPRNPGLHADAVDAYSIWYDQVPYVFLTRRKTSERIRFDLAHELGHLVLHGDVPAETTAEERAADAFASEFLIPRELLSSICGTTRRFRNC